jgi:hypothetical protein
MLPHRHPTWSGLRFIPSLEAKRDACAILFSVDRE